MRMLLDALQFATEKHGGQVRKGSGLPYVTHPMAVSCIVAAYKRSKHLDELLVATLLHDLLEDTDVTFVELATRFTPLVASLVLELSNDKEEIARVGKLDYQVRKLLGISSYGLVIKLADRLHNISDNPTPQMVADTLVLMAQLRAGRKLSTTQLALVEEIERLCAARQAHGEETPA